MTVPGALVIAALWLSPQVTIMPGDSTRGAALFVEKGCIHCHSFNGKGGNVAPDLARRSDESHSPSKLAAELWNHSPMMWSRLSSEVRAVPFMSSIDTADLFAYFYSLELSAGNPSRGLNLFERDCENCHTFGATQPHKTDLLSRRAPQTASGYAASIKNHKTAGTLPKLMENEIRDLTSYLFAQRYFAEPGDATRGAEIYVSKGCASCHDTKPLGKAAPELAQATERFSPVTITSVLWRSGPAMLAAMEQKNMKWPEFHGSEMTDLIAYLNQNLLTRIGR
jgi:mono/diheme cytochrome c family protein